MSINCCQVFNQCEGLCHWKPFQGVNPCGFCHRWEVNSLETRFFGIFIILILSDARGDVPWVKYNQTLQIECRGFVLNWRGPNRTEPEEEWQTCVAILYIQCRTTIFAQTATAAFEHLCSMYTERRSDIHPPLHNYIRKLSFQLVPCHVILMCPQGGVIQQEPCVTDGNASVLWKDDLVAH